MERNLVPEQCRMVSAAADVAPDYPDSDPAQRGQLCS